MIETPPEKQFETHSSVLYFRVPHIDRAYETLKQRGVPFEDAPHVIHKAQNYELKMAFFRDPDGNMHAIMSETGNL
jgi:methylmalonyl-CoA/ethylmalonyl-CoA epimerase